MISRVHLFMLVTAYLEKKVGARRARLTVDLLKLVFSATIVQFNGELWTTTEGIPTGVRFAVVLADLYLRNLDEWLVRNLRNQCSLFLYARFLDDLVIICDLSGKKLKEICDTWHKTITFDISGEESEKQSER